MALKIPLISIVFFLLFSFKVSLAQNQKVLIVGETPIVYQAPDFDSQVLAELERGKIYIVSTNKFGMGFYRVLVKPGMTGYIADAEVQLVNPKTEKAITAAKKIQAQKKKSKNQTIIKSRTNSKPFMMSRYRGVIFESMDYTEDTMSKTRNSQLTLIGFRVAGMDTMFSGEMSTDASILLYSGAPKYYQEVTGYGASGWMMIAQFTFDTLFPFSPIGMVSYGIGPSFKYSHFITSLKNTTNSFTTDYPMDDMTLGVLIRLGLAFRINQLSLRSDVKYYIESKRYFSYNLSALFEF